MTYRTSFTAAARADREETIVDGRFSSSGDIALSDGSATQGAIYFADDKNTGIYSPSNDSIAFTTSGSAALTLASDNDATFAGDLHIDSDTKKLKLGDDGAFEIYETANHDFITAGTGNLYINNAAYIQLAESQTGDKYITATKDAGVVLHWDNSPTLETTASGAKTTGQLEVTGDVKISEADPKIHLTDTNADSDFTLELDAGIFQIRDVTNDAFRLKIDSTGKVTIGQEAQFNGDVNISDNKDLTWGEDFNIWRASSGNNYIASNAGKLYIRGNSNADAIVIETDGDSTFKGDLHIDSDSKKLKLGDDGSFEIYYDGTDSYIRNHTNGNINIRANDNLTIAVNASGGGAEDAIIVTKNGSVSLAWDGTPKFETTTAGATLTGALTATGTVTCTSLTETSDIALKTNIEPITNVLDKINQITGYKYDFTKSNTSSIGVIAQDVEKVFPELVHGEEGSKSLQYSGLIGALIESVKELSAKVAALESS